MKLEQLEVEARFVARHAARNLKTILRNPEAVSPDKLDHNIEYLKMMIRLNKADLKAQKNARRACRTLSLRSRLMSLLSSILTPDSQKSKGETA
ncbi:hypothetical protein D3C87_993970 [compost metagenome]